MGLQNAGQLELMKAQANKLNAEAKKIGGVDTLLTEADADKRVEEIRKLGLENKKSAAVMNDEIKTIGVELANARLQGLLTIEVTKKTQEETNKIIESVLQDWKKVMIAGQQMNINAFKAKVERDYPTVFQVGGMIGKKMWESLENVENWIRGKEINPTTKIEEFKKKD